jgi:hypothetical protein
VTWYADLTPFRYASLYKGDAILHVGWLDAPHSYRRGPVTRKELVAIKQLVAKSCQPFIVCGGHECTLCPKRKRQVRHARPGHPDGSLGIYNLFVPDPSRERLYVARISPSITSRLTVTNPRARSSTRFSPVTLPLPASPRSASASGGAFGERACPYT